LFDAPLMGVGLRLGASILSAMLFVTGRAEAHARRAPKLERH
jgi:hypothetical protein